MTDSTVATQGVNTPDRLKEIREDMLTSAVRRALDAIGGSASLLVLLGALGGYERFEDWKRQHSMSPSVLSKRLSALVDNGFLRREPGRIRADHPRYALTEKGKALMPWALAVWRWEHKWLHRGRRHPVMVIHADCGQVTEPHLNCANCHLDLRLSDVSFERAKGFTPVVPKHHQVERRTIVDSGRDGSGYVGRIVDIVGDRWSHLILGVAIMGVTRFDDFQTCLEIAPNILSDRLRLLVDAEILEKTAYNEGRVRYEYGLKDKGADLYSVLVTMGQWADEWLPDDTSGHLRRHRPCGADLDVIATCDVCQGVLTHQNTTFVYPQGVPDADAPLKRKPPSRAAPDPQGK